MEQDLNCPNFGHLDNPLSLLSRSRPNRSLPAMLVHIFPSECAPAGVIQRWRQCIVEVAHSPCEFPQAELLKRWMKRCERTGQGLLARPWLVVFLNVRKRRRFLPFVSPCKEKNKTSKFVFFLKVNDEVPNARRPFSATQLQELSIYLPIFFICLYNLLRKKASKRCFLQSHMW